MLKQNKTDYSAIALFSGGLDSLLAVKWMQKAGYKVYPVYFLTPYMPIERALESARDNGLDLIIRDITEEHLKMMQDPETSFGKNLNPCIDCHALMFRMAGDMLSELDADFLISGEVVGQRPMSQRRDTLNRVAKLSGYRDLIIRPLSQKLLRKNTPIREGWVDLSDMLDFHGRGRSRQLQLAEELGITRFPSPAGGCLLTDRNYTLRIKDLISHQQMDEKNLELLKYGRHFRLDESTKLIIGRDERENDCLERLSDGLIRLKAKNQNGPLGLLTDDPTDPIILNLALSIFWFYHPKAPQSGIINIRQGGKSKEHEGQKASPELSKQYRISYD
ncbi:MAG: tRNA (5-methylaminomethyl-2-thiouridylate)-methyltransferase [Candidatus Cloacimonetes bacterium]|nr:tRNA (5-methylaminomethyl-2-thiouridylate)-methyltransferase [Candidatus Cloacimonadota bacterium]